MPNTPRKPHHVVIVGGGFAGLFAARALGRRRDDGVRVTLLDKRNFHLFQPLLYQVATGSLVVGDIAVPQRVVLRRFRNVQTLMATAYDLDPARRTVYFEGGEIDYDSLIVATGVKHHYFGKDQWRDYAPGLKTVEHALEMRRRIFSAFERAELATSQEQRQALLSFVVVGGGPTGVELAGALGELAHRTMLRDFRSIDPREARILLVEGTGDVLPTYIPKLRAAARRQLEALGVTVITQTLVEEVGPGFVRMRTGEQVQTVAAETVLWAAGVRASAFGEVVAQRTGAQFDRAGKLLVNPDLSLPGYPDIYVAGDLAHCKDDAGQPVPGVAQAAIQQGRHVARQLRRRLSGHAGSRSFRYFDPGSMAVIGRNKAVGDLRLFRVSGIGAWFIWAGVHIWALIDPEQRLNVMFHWVWKYFTYKNGSRLVTGDPPRTRDLIRERDRSTGTSA